MRNLETTDVREEASAVTGTHKWVEEQSRDSSDKARGNSTRSSGTQQGWRSGNERQRFLAGYIKPKIGHYGGVVHLRNGKKEKRPVLEEPVTQKHRPPQRE
jgi:hypothetical protein